MEAAREFHEYLLVTVITAQFERDYAILCRVENINVRFCVRMSNKDVPHQLTAHGCMLLSEGFLPP
jgi:hypothetical protein